MMRSPLLRRFILMLAAALVLLLFYLLPGNRVWVNGRIARFYKALPAQVTKLDEESRKESYYGGYYTYSKQIAAAIRSRTNDRNVLLLVPSTYYFKERGIEYYVPEPSVFYYFTGIKTTWSNCSDAHKANWYVRAADGVIIIDSVSDQKQFADTLALFKKYRTRL